MFNLYAEFAYLTVPKIQQWSMSVRPSGTAVIIGGSIGGLLAAAALAERFEKVQIIERDRYDPSVHVRKGVPQSAHVHGFLSTGKESMERLLPGITARVIAAGGAEGDMLTDAAFYVGGQRFVPGTSGIVGLVASRSLIEKVVREMVSALPNVDIHYGMSVDSLIYFEGVSQVIGVKASSTGKPNSGREFVGDLIVDASGRGSRSVRWLEDMGFPAPLSESIDVDVTYTSAWFRRNPDDNLGVRAVFCAPTADNPVPAGMMEQEDNRWVVSCGGYGGNSAPDNIEGFLAYLKQYVAPEVHRVVSQCEVLVEPTQFRIKTSKRNRYDKLKRFPEKYVVLGDALCSFNPVYGQGMTIAAAEAEILKKLVSSSIDRLGPRFFKQAIRMTDNAWEFAVASDLAIPSVLGKRPFGFALANRYVDRMMKAASQNLSVAIDVLKVVHLIDSPLALMSPSMLLRVWRSS